MNIKKAKSEQVAVYNASGQLVGVVDSAKITALRDASALLGDDKAQPIPSTSSAGAVQDEAELQPTPSDAVGVPADGQRTVAKGRGARPVLRDATERGFAAQAVQAVNAAQRRGDSPAAVELIRQRAAAATAEQIKRHRTPTRG